MKTFDDLSPEQQLENIRRWKEYYKTDRDEANAEIEQLEAINAELVEAVVAFINARGYEASLEKARIKARAAIAKARGES